MPSAPSQQARPLPRSTSGCQRGRCPSLGQPILDGVIHKILKQQGCRAHTKWPRQVTCREACDGTRPPFIPDSCLAQGLHVLGSWGVNSGRESQPDGSGVSKHSLVVDGHFVRVSNALFKCFSIFLLLSVYIYIYMGFPGGSEYKASACNVGDPGSIRGLGRSPGEGNGNPLQYSCLGNPTNRGDWRPMGLQKSDT